MNKLDIYNKARQITANFLNCDESSINLETSFSENLAMDDLDVIELLMSFEQEFHINIPDYQAEKFATFGDLFTYLDIQYT